MNEAVQPVNHIDVDELLLLDFMYYSFRNNDCTWSGLHEWPPEGAYV